LRLGASLEVRAVIEADAQDLAGFAGSEQPNSRQGEGFVRGAPAAEEVSFEGEDAIALKLTVLLAALVLET
jgi:hypothetical protein